MPRIPCTNDCQAPGFWSSRYESFVVHAAWFHVSCREGVGGAERRDWRIWADFARVMIGEARGLYADDAFGVELDQTVYAFDSTTIDLCLSLFPWATFRKTKAAVKAHSLLDLRGEIPCWVHVTPASVHDVNALDLLVVEPGSVYIMDRGYLDFSRLFTMNRHGAFFITRTKSNTRYRRLYSHRVDKSTGLRCDQTVFLTGFYTKKDYPDKLRVVKCVDPETDKRLIFLTNHFGIPARIVADLYRLRWRVELFFKWIKQHLRIKAFFGTSENAVKTQIWIVISVYVLVAILKKRLGLDGLSLYTILQILSVSLFEKKPLLQALIPPNYTNKEDRSGNQLDLFRY